MPLAFTASWASGINPYLLVLMMGLWVVSPTGTSRRAGADRCPRHLRGADRRRHGGRQGHAGRLGVDAVNTVIRPVAGAVVAALIASPSTDIPTVAIAAAGGGIALITHLAKATTRIAVNTSPEPASNIAVSIGEDVAVAGSWRSPW